MKIAIWAQHTARSGGRAWTYDPQSSDYEEDDLECADVDVVECEPENLTREAAYYRELARKSSAGIDQYYRRVAVALDEEAECWPQEGE